MKGVGGIVVEMRKPSKIIPVGKECGINKNVENDRDAGTGDSEERAAQGFWISVLTRV